jgi:hypothetical protein
MFATTLPRLLISLPLLALPLTAMHPAPALAAGVAEVAVEILTRAKTADGRCNYLSATERSELTRYTARAEIAAASQNSTKAAKSAASRGAAQGKAETCSPSLRADVRETLQAAREAVAAAGSQAPAEPVAPKHKKTEKSLAQADDGTPPRKTGGGLARYTRVVRAYYLERECRSLTRGEADRFWRGIVRLHKSAVAGHGVAAVAPVMRAAERRAGGTSCGGKVLALIRDGYSEVSSQ